MTDKEYRKDLAIIHGKIYSLMQAVALLTAKSITEDYDEALISRYEAVLKRMKADAETQAMMFLDQIEAQDLGDNQ